MIGYRETTGRRDGIHKTVNSHSSMHYCGCSCILSCYVIIWNQTDLQIGSCRDVNISSCNNEFWKALDELGCKSEIVIDRPSGTSHPKFPDFIYHVDGYLKNTTSMDGAGIDVWVGIGHIRRPAAEFVILRQAH